MDLGTVIGVDILPQAAGVIIAIIIVLFSVRVAQHFYHKRRAEIEQKRVDKTKRIYFPW
jgi:hypothetical protein